VKPHFKGNTFEIAEALATRRKVLKISIFLGSRRFIIAAC
jgi:hypothetical protein